MKMLLSLCLFFTLALTTAQAGFLGLSAGTSLSFFGKINCGTGLTCTRVGDKFNMVSSPTITAGSFTVAGVEAGNADFILSADEADDNADSWKLQSQASGNAFSILSNTSGSYVSKFTVSTAGAVTMVGDLSGDGGDQLVGFLNNQVAATATTITAAQCGSSFINTGAVQMELPEASAVLGCRLTFITGNASNFDVNPDNADQILVETNAAGDAMRNATLGNSITIEAISASQWAPVANVGTYTDIN